MPVTGPGHLQASPVKRQP